MYLWIITEDSSQFKFYIQSTRVIVYFKLISHRSHAWNYVTMARIVLQAAKTHWWYTQDEAEMEILNMNTLSLNEIWICRWEAERVGLHYENHKLRWRTGRLLCLQKWFFWQAIYSGRVIPCQVIQWLLPYYYQLLSF